jgi:hypothetical protein
VSVGFEGLSRDELPLNLREGQALVYALYGLTEEEIEIVEQAGRQ